MKNDPRSSTVPLPDFSRDDQYWQKTGEIIDQLIDVILNYRQSGHPGGSRSKVQLLLSLMLSGVMRWDIRDPGKRFADRFILGAGHTIPLVYCTLAALNEAMRLKFKRSGEDRFKFELPMENNLFWQDLLGFRRRGGLSGHAEMQGKTLFLKFNTGPSGHGSTAAVGEALALKRAGLKDVRVFLVEGEGGLTPGATHESMNSAWGLNLDNLFFLVDWNDYGIDDHPTSTVVYGNPEIWFSAHGWHVTGAEKGEDFQAITQSLIEMVNLQMKESAPAMVWVKTRKGRGYLKYDNASHGSPHKTDSEIFWETKKPFAEKYNVEFTNFGGPPPEEPDELRQEFKVNLQAVMQVMADDEGLVDYLAERLIAIGDSVPREINCFRLDARGNPFRDSRLYDFENYPPEIYLKPGEKAANRAGLAKWGAWVNAFGAKEYNQPIFLACSADLCESTNISGFGKAFGDFPGYGWYERKGSDRGALLPQAITEMTNAGIMTGLAAVNLSENPHEEFAGFYGACSTYGSFSYLKYGLMRLFSQMSQDSDWKLGKVLWVAGHSGPETADDSRTHFGIFAPGVTQLFPRGSVINLHPWEHYEVAPLLGAALSLDVPIIALHLTRPAVEIPDRAALGMPGHFEAAKGAYVLRNYQDDQARDGAIVVQGTSAVANLVKVLSDLDEEKLNVKIVCATSAELFARQSQEYRDEVFSPADRVDSTFITTQGKSLMRDWVFNPMAEEYALAPDWDDRWRTGGTLEEVVDEAHLATAHILTAIRRFAGDRARRLEKLNVGIQRSMNKN